MKSVHAASTRFIRFAVICHVLIWPGIVSGQDGSSGWTRTSNPPVNSWGRYLSGPEIPAENQASTKASTKLVVPAIVFSTAQGLDVWTTHRARSSGNGREGNGLMDVGTGGQIAIKAGATVGIVWLAQKVGRRHPRLAQGLLYGLSGIVAGVAVHNESIARR